MFKKMSLLAVGVGLVLRLLRGIVIFFIEALLISLTGHLYLSLIESNNSPLVLMFLILAVIGLVSILII
jgi:hypothetical protein